MGKSPPHTFTIIEKHKKPHGVLCPMFMTPAERQRLKDDNDSAPGSFGHWHTGSSYAFDSNILKL